MAYARKEDAIDRPAPPTFVAEPDFGPEANRVYEKALRALNASGEPYLLGGAFAFNHYTGIWRNTKDLDVFIEPERADDIHAVLEQAGFESQTVYPSWLRKSWLDGLFVDVIFRNSNGLFPVTDEWHERSRASRLLGHDVRVIPIENLILSKCFVASRLRFDGADVAHLLFRGHEDIDWDHMVATAGEHWELLLSQLVLYRWTYPAFQHHVPARILSDLLARVGEEDRDGPPVGTPSFRGTLLDHVSYTVDVRDFGLPDPHEDVLKALPGGPTS